MAHPRQEAGWLDRVFHRATLFLLLAIVALGGLLRFHQIGSKGLWLDEAFSVWFGWQPVLSHNTAVFFPIAVNMFVAGLLLVADLGFDPALRAAGRRHTPVALSALYPCCCSDGAGGQRPLAARIPYPFREGAMGRRR